MRSPRLFRFARVVVAGGCLLAVAGCEMATGSLAGHASDEWTRSYPLTPGGEVRIVNTSGRVEIEGADTGTVEVHAERIARATTELAARELVSHITIREDVRPDRVAIETERPAGILIGVSFEVRYRVRAPRTAVIRVQTTNGAVTLTSLEGRVDARSKNGGVTGRDLRGGVEASTTNGGVTMELASVGADGVRLKTVNGGIQLTLPETAKADLTATCTNGGIDVSGLQLDVQEQSRRRVGGRLNGGGAAVELRTVNGGIRVRARSSETSNTTTGPQTARHVVAARVESLRRVVLVR